MNEHDLSKLEDIMKKYDETILINTDENKEYKLAPDALKSIARAWKTMCMEDKSKLNEIICNNIKYE